MQQIIAHGLFGLGLSSYLGIRFGSGSRLAEAA
jgi:hypothetical protein